MKIKKGFVKNSWIAIFVVIIVAGMAVQTRSVTMAMAEVLFIIALVIRYRKYDEIEQEADEWWQTLDTEKKIKVKGHQ